MSTHELDFDARYSVDGYSGVAFWIAPREVAEIDEYGDEIDLYTDPDFVLAVMVGDDRRHVIDVDDLSIIADDDYCHACGQIGCTHDGRE